MLQKLRNDDRGFHADRAPRRHPDHRHPRRDRPARRSWASGRRARTRPPSRTPATPSRRSSPAYATSRPTRTAAPPRPAWPTRKLPSTVSVTAPGRGDVHDRRRPRSRATRSRSRRRRTARSPAPAPPPARAPARRPAPGSRRTDIRLAVRGGPPGPPRRVPGPSRVAPLGHRPLPDDLIDPAPRRRSSGQPADGRQGQTAREGGTQSHGPRGSRKPSCRTAGDQGLAQPDPPRS